MKHNIRIIALGTALVAVSFGLAGGVFAADMTLDQAIAKALSYDPTVRRIFSDVIQADGYAKETRADLRPHLALEGGLGAAGREQNSQSAFANGDALFSRNVSLVGRQLLWSNGYYSNRYLDAKERLAAKQMLEQEQRETTAFAVVEAYLDVVTARKQVVFAQDNLNNHNGVVDLTNKRGDSAGNGADVQLAGARTDLAESLLRERRLAILQSEARFIRLVGEKPPANLATPKVPRIGSFDEVDPRENWHYKAVKKQYEAALLGKKSIRGKYAPRVYLEVRGSLGENVDGISGRDRAASAMVTAAWDILDGGSRKAEVQQADADIERQAAILEETFITIRQDASARWEDYKTLSKRIEVFRQYKDNLKKTVGLYQEQFGLGTRPLLSILDIQNEVTSANIRITDAERDHAALGYRLLYFGGKLIPRTAGDEYIATPRNPNGSAIQEPVVKSVKIQSARSYKSSQANSK